MKNHKKIHNHDKHTEQLKLYRAYIDNCITHNTEKYPVFPLSFDEWYHLVHVTDQAA